MSTWVYGMSILLVVIDRCLGCFHIWVIMNNTVRNIHVQVFVLTCSYFSWVYTDEWDC